GGENNRRKQNTNGRRSPWRNMCLPFCLSCNGGVNLYSCEEVEMFRAKKLIVLVLCVCAFNVLGSFAQTTTGRSGGSVADEDGAVIPGVDITVRNPATGLVRNVVTNESGAFVVPLLPPAVYDVEASLNGFQREVRSGVTLQVDIVVRVDFSLHV